MLTALAIVPLAAYLLTWFGLRIYVHAHIPSDRASSAFKRIRKESLKYIVSPFATAVALNFALRSPGAGGRLYTVHLILLGILILVQLAFSVLVVFNVRLEVQSEKAKPEEPA